MRDAGGDLARIRRITHDDRAENLLVIVARESGLEAKQFIHRCAERIDVRTVVDRDPFGHRLLGAQVSHGSQQRAGHCHGLLFHALGQSEIGDHDPPVDR